MRVHRHVPCMSTHPISVAVPLCVVYRHLRCKSLDRNCTCLTSLGLDHVKWNMRQLRAVRSRFTTWPHDFVLCGDRDCLNVIDTTEHFLPRRRKRNRFSKRCFHTTRDNGKCFCHLNFFFAVSLFLFPSSTLHNFFPKQIDQTDYVNEVCWMEEIQRTGHTSMCEVFEFDTGNFKVGLTRAENDTRKYVLGTWHSLLLHYLFRLIDQRSIL